MPIEFRCAGCAQTLRVPDDVAGKSARCPSCGAIAIVPFHPAPVEATPTGASQGGEFSPSNNPYAESTPSFGPAAPADPYGAIGSYGPQAPNPYAAPITDPKPGLGLQPEVGVQITNQPVGVDAILSHAWQVWKENLGLLVGVTVVAGIINFGVSYFFDTAARLLQQNDAAQEVVMIVSLLGSAAGQAVQTFLGIGETQIVLKMLRRQPAQFSDLFGGGPMFLPVLGFSILFGFAVVVGFLLLIVPGVILLLMCWPAYFLVLDRKAGIIDSFSLAATITKDNWGTAFVLWLASVGIILVGLLALCIGVIFAAPLVSVIWGTAYLMMSGQLLPHRPAPIGYLPPGYPPPGYPQSMPGKY